MFNDNDDEFNCSRIQKTEEYDHIIYLNQGESVEIGAFTELVFLGTELIWGEQARFALRAPEDVSILRLELFARHFQVYDREINLRFGERISIGSDLQICLLPQPNVVGEVCIGINSKISKTVKKSLFNCIVKEKKSD
jgi:sRNA-binding carbon storage regulator CsrA